MILPMIACRKRRVIVNAVDMVERVKEAYMVA